MSKFGGWTIEPSSTKMPQKVASSFDKVEKVFGCTYKAISYVGKQEVNGINYAVLAEQTVITGEDTKNAVIMIFNEKPESSDLAWVGTIPVVEGGGKFGGTDVEMMGVECVGNPEKDVFNKAIEGFVGSNIELVATVGTKVTKGIEHKFIVTIAPVVPGAEKKLAVMSYNDMTKEMNFEPLLAAAKLGYSFTW